jgi:hypothetical protein
VRTGPQTRPVLSANSSDKGAGPGRSDDVNAFWSDYPTELHSRPGKRPGHTPLSPPFVCVTERAEPPYAQQSQPSPRQASRPSRAATPAMTSAASGSSHHAPRSALPSSPTRSAADR